MMKLAVKLSSLIRGYLGSQDTFYVGQSRELAVFISKTFVDTTYSQSVFCQKLLQD